MQFDINHTLPNELEMMRHSVDRAAESIFWLNREGSIIYVNDAACIERGYSREEMLGMKIFDLDPDYQPGVWDLHFEDLKQRGTITLETRHRTKSGHEYPVEVSANYIHIGENEFNFCFLRDITKRKQADLTIRESSKKWQLLFENMPTGFALHDVVCDEQDKVVDYRFLEVNPAYEQLTGLNANSIIGRTVLEVLPDTEAYWIEIFGNVALTGKSTTYENFSTELGKWFQVKVFSPRLRQFALMLSDITERKQAEDQLIRMNNELEERVTRRTSDLAEINNALHRANEELKRTQNELIQREKMTALGVLVAGVSHEMNTPLGNSLTASSSMQEEIVHFETDFENGKVTKTRLKEFNQYLQNGLDLVTRNLNRAIEQLVHFKQVSVDQASENRRSFDLKAVVDDNISILLPQFKHSPHHIEVDIPGGIRMDSYPGAIGQLITNLVLNSLIHGFSADMKGVVSISATPEDGGTVRLIVTDNGHGIPPKNLDRVFDPFFTTRMGQGGSGLGLNIAFNIIKSTLGGNIQVDSQVDSYTTFTMIMPRTAP